MPIESLRLRFALLQSLNTTLETFFLPLVELRPTPMYAHSIAALLKEAKGQRLRTAPHVARPTVRQSQSGRRSLTWTAPGSAGTALPAESSYFSYTLKN